MEQLDGDSFAKARATVLLCEEHLAVGTGPDALLEMESATLAHVSDSFVDDVVGDDGFPCGELGSVFVAVVVAVVVVLEADPDVHLARGLEAWVVAREVDHVEGQVFG